MADKSDSAFRLSGFFIFLLLSVILITGTIFIYIKSPKPSKYSPPTDLSAWKTYTSQSYFFSIRYPDSWSFKEQNQSLIYFFPVNEINSADSSTVIGSKSVSIGIRSINTPMDPVYLQTRTLRTILLGGERIKLLQVTNLPSERYFTELKRGNYYYKFSAGSNFNTKSDRIFDQILSTFRFIK